MIHAARKRRQMAREMGVPGDYMSINTTSENGNDGISNRKSRLIRYEIPSFLLIKIKSKYLVMMKMTAVMKVVLKIHI
jgi:hypothetical protein